MSDLLLLLLIIAAVAGFVVGVFFLVVWWLEDLDRYVYEQMQSGDWPWDDYP
ncbi:MAG TPA: hypothetical protein VGG32_03750 [Thermoplasmata archaeon]